MTGPLHGMRIVELAGLGPVPFCGMMLADHGAEVIRIRRVGDESAAPIDDRRDVMLRSRRNVAVDLKASEGMAFVTALVATADGLIEGFRPGVMERIGLGPETLLAANPKLVYGRMTGWGQSGPLAHAAGHDINYIALSGALHAFGHAGERPTPPLNLVGDFGGGGMLLAFSMVGAMLHAHKTGEGQVIDCAMTEGSALLMSMIWGLRSQDLWQDVRGSNILDGGAHFYDTYATEDGKFVAVGAIEPQFYALLLEKVGLADDPDFAPQMDMAKWPALKQELAARFRTKSRDEWCEIMEGTDICFAPVLSMSEAPHHPHNQARNSFDEIDGVIQPSPAPRFSNTPPERPTMPGRETDTDALLAELGYAPDRIAGLRAEGVLR